MIHTQELIFPISEKGNPYFKDAKCLDDMIANFQRIHEDEYEVIDVRYCFNIISRVEMQVSGILGGKTGTPKAYEVPVSTALVLYKEIK